MTPPPRHILTLVPPVGTRVRLARLPAPLDPKYAALRDREGATGTVRLASDLARQVWVELDAPQSPGEGYWIDVGALEVLP
ncbi:hypothetical protein [Calidithermus chliarophilus]|uniref:hypothetical protein n=1 Tax=Calidithermus chliarophilus TaxID=52023 RepID=UPI0004083429|nr:hypothetical protein [Calidithermus chliarophilus]